MEQEHRGKCHIVDIIYNFQREDALSRKTVVNSVTDTNPENLDQEHDINV